MTVAASRRRDRQVVRILGILGTLLKGSQPSIRQLANRYGTRRETIYRDMRALEEAGYPIVGDEQGRLSHPRLLAEARRYAPHLRLSDSEIAALLWASKLAKTSSPFRSALASAGMKLRAMGTSTQAALAAGIDSAFGEGGFSAKDYEPHKETVLRLVEAIVRRKRCDLRYWSPANPSTKRYEFEPYRLLTVSGTLYCLGRVPPYENVTTLAVDRIQALDMTDANFVVDPGFDADRYQRESFGVIWEKPMNVVIRFSADQAPYVRERVWHSTQRIRELRDGRMELSFRAGGAFEIARWVLGWGDAAEVIRPARLRVRVAQILEAAARAYGQSSIPASR
jgi:proteasome accessory factor B